MVRYASIVQSKPDDIHALGQATYSFAMTEWAAIWVIEALQPGFIVPEVGGMTAGQVSKHFEGAVAGYKGSLSTEILGRLRAAQEEFDRLRLERNHLVHARPITDSDGAQRLYRNYQQTTIVWTPEKIDGFCREVDDLGRELNELFHHWLR